MRLLAIYSLVILLTSCGDDSFTNSTPNPQPPRTASNVNFHEEGEWQIWKYFYKFDDTPEVCESFAISLMKEQSSKGTNCVITKTQFTRFPVGTALPPWFDVSTVTNGILLSGDDWIYAVVDKERGRLYYYNGH